MRSLFFSTCFLIATVAACSSSSGGASGSGSSDAGSGDQGDGGGSCSCSITFNDVSGNLSCGQSGCVNGESFSCASDGSGSSDRGACTTGQKDGGGGDSGSGGTCDMLLSSCAEISATSDTCCTGLHCVDVMSTTYQCFVNRRGSCSSPSQCDPGTQTGTTADSCTMGACCGASGSACDLGAADPGCCSGLTCTNMGSSGVVCN